MSTELYMLMSRNQDAIGQWLVARLSGSYAPHYHLLERDELKKRTIRLVEAFVASIRHHPMLFVECVQQIAEERISEGYLLEEIQLALSLLEQKAWEVVVGNTPLEKQVEQLRRISYTIGQSKDELARVYLEDKRQAESRFWRGAREHS